MSLLALIRTVAPTVEPVSLAEAKAWLRVDADFTLDDAIITSLISSTREQVEDYLGRSLASQQWRLNLDFWPNYVPNSTAPARPAAYLGTANFWWDTQAIHLPRSPLQSVDSIQYRDVTGTLQVLDSTVYTVDAASEPARILPAYNSFWPTALTVPNAITIAFTTGYADVPETFKLAIKLLIAAYYENPSEITATTANTLPCGVNRLLHKHRIASFDYSIR